MRRPTHVRTNLHAWRVAGIPRVVLWVKLAVYAALSR